MQSYLRKAFTCSHVHLLSVHISLSDKIQLTYSFIISSSEGQNGSIFFSSINFIKYRAND